MAREVQVGDMLYRIKPTDSHWVQARGTAYAQNEWHDSFYVDDIKELMLVNGFVGWKGKDGKIYCYSARGIHCVSDESKPSKSKKKKKSNVDSDNEEKSGCLWFTLKAIWWVIKKFCKAIWVMIQIPFKLFNNA